MQFSLEVGNDAGLLREYVVEHYGHCLTYGAGSQVFWRAERLTRRIAKLTGLPFEQVLTDIRNDYQQRADALGL